MLSMNSNLPRLDMRDNKWYPVMKHTAECIRGGAALAAIGFGVSGLLNYSEGPWTRLVAIVLW